jgi:hypothetical protein
MEPLWDEVRAAEYLTLPIKTLQNWRSQGRGPAYYKIGRCVRYRQSMLDEFCAKHLVKPVTAT